MEEGANAIFRGQFLRRGSNQGHQNTALLERLKRAFLSFAINSVEHYVNLAHDIFKTRLPIINRMVHSQIVRERVIFRRSGSYDVSASCLRQLDGEVADATRRRVDQHLLTRA